MVRHSAGILLFRRGPGAIEVLLAHPGGPYWARKDDHAWSIPKGEFDPNAETPAQAATRELTEETGASVTGPLIPLSTLKQPHGKVIHAFAVEQNFDAAHLKSNTFSLEWPPRSGRTQEVPEVDRIGWFAPNVARIKLVPGQVEFLDRLMRALADPPEPDNRGA